MVDRTIQPERFNRRELLWRKSDSADTVVAKRVTLPEIVVAGYIGKPATPNRDKALVGLPPTEKRAVKLVLSADNPDPPDSVRSGGQWDQLLASQEYRAVLGFTNNQLEVNRHGQLLRGSSDWIAKPGYTPIGPRGLRQFWPGLSRATEDVTDEMEKVVLATTMKIRIGDEAAWVGKALTGFQTSWAAVSMRLVMSASGLETVSIFATPVPSIKVYIDGQGVLCHDCLAGDFQHVLEFIRLDGKEPEMRQVYFKRFD